MTANGTIHFQEKSITLAANEGADISVTANYLACTEATNTFKVSIDDSAASDFKLGRKIQTEMFFRKVRFENPNASPITIKYIVGVGDVQDDANILDGGVRTKSGETLETPSAANVTTTSAEIVPANSDNTRVWILNNGVTSSDIVYIGEAGVSAADGMPLAQGQSAILETGASIHAVSNNAVGVDTRLMIERV